MKYDYHIIVIGAGSGGLVVASGAAGLGAKVALIEGHKMGGDCLHYGCVPSKTFLRSAHLAQDIQKAQAFGLEATLQPVDLSKVMDRVKAVIKSIEPHDSKDRYESLGVTVFEGKGEFEDTHTIRIGKQTITGKYIVIATGSEAALPPIKGLDQTPYLTNKTIFNLKTLPKRLIVLGGGPIGLELGQGFRHLGSEVAVIDMLDALFPNDDVEAGLLMKKVLQDENIDLYLSSKILEVSKAGDLSPLPPPPGAGEALCVLIEKRGKKQKIYGDQILVSLGRKPQTKGLNLEKIGIEVDKRGFLVCNSRLQTNQSHIYGCGDVVGPFQFTHMAGYQAGVILKNIIFKLPAKVNDATVPWVTYTKPEVAHVGYTEQQAKALGLYKESIQVDIDKMDRAKADLDSKGFLKVITNQKNRIIGITLVGEKAGEMIALGSLAIQKKLKVTAFLQMVFSYPTISEIYKFASLAVAKKSLKPWMRTIIKKII